MQVVAKWVQVELEQDEAPILFCYNERQVTWCRADSNSCIATSSPFLDGSGTCRYYVLPSSLHSSGPVLCCTHLGLLTCFAAHLDFQTLISLIDVNFDVCSSTLNFLLHLRLFSPLTMVCLCLAALFISIYSDLRAKKVAIQLPYPHDTDIFIWKSTLIYNGEFPTACFTNTTHSWQSYQILEGHYESASHWHHIVPRKIVQAWWAQQQCVQISCHSIAGCDHDLLCHASGMKGTWSCSVYHWQSMVLVIPTDRSDFLQH